MTSSRGSLRWRTFIVLWIFWMLLAQDASAGTLLTGALSSALISLATAPLVPRFPRIRSARALAGYVSIVIWDIIVANLRVARRVVGSPSALRPAMVEIPIDIRDPAVVAVLAATVTLTPGTLTVEADPASGRLLVHVLHTEDPSTVAGEIRDRYERRLKEVFAC